MEDRYFIYRHIRLDTNKPFYIGVGTKKFQFKTHNYLYCRAYETTGRNPFWKNVVVKTKYLVEIIFEDDSFDIIQQKEKEFIQLYGRIDLGLGTLTNLTDGGDGCSGRSCSNETKQKISKSNTLSEEKVEKIIKLYKLGHGAEDICNVVGVCNFTVRKFLLKTFSKIDYRKKICCYDKDGNLLYYDKIDYICDKINVSANFIYNKLRSKLRKTISNYYFSIDLIDKQVIQELNLRKLKRNKRNVVNKHTE